MLFDKILTIVKIDFTLSPNGPILIKSGTDSFLEPALSDMTFVRAMTPWGESMYIPGSSLKGVVRSYSEAYLKTMGKNVCDLFGKSSCGTKLKNKESGEERYKNSCLACKTFGSTVLASKVSISDMFPFKVNDQDDEKRKKIEELSKNTFIKYGVAINREKGSVAFGPFDMEVLYGGTFYGSVTITNPELWQIGLVLSAFSDMNDGYVQIGFAKSRGLGRVKIGVKDLEIATVENALTFVKGVNGKEKYQDTEKEFERRTERASLYNVWSFTGNDIFKSEFLKRARNTISNAV